MRIVNEIELYVNELPNTLIIGITGSGKSYIANKMINCCIANNYKMALVDPKRVEYSSFERLDNLVTPIGYDKKTMDDLSEFLSNYDSKEKLYLFIDEYAEVLMESKKLVDVINSKKDNICVIACLQNPSVLNQNDISTFDFEMVLKLPIKLEGRLETKRDTLNYFRGECIIKDLITNEEIDKVTNLKCL